jgi:serine/threonine protein phosphatase PrpC
MLPQHLEAQLTYMMKKYEDDLVKNNKDEQLNTDEVCIAFNNAFLNSNEELFSGIMDIRFSGSTCVTVLTMGQKLFCSNVGDSRGIIVKKKAGDTSGKFTAQAISRDQKPCQADEAARIIKYGGRIDSFRDPENNPIGPLRVWLKTEDIPGLAMTRSFGDEVASRVGVTAEPGK